MNELTPTAGQWYVRPDHLKFEVIDVNDEDGLIEIQDEDGTLDEIDAEDWPTISLDLAPQSEDASGSFDNVPLADEADGGEASVPENSAAELESVSNEDRINSSYDDDDDEEEEDTDQSAERSRYPLSKGAF